MPASRSTACSSQAHFRGARANARDVLFVSGKTYGGDGGETFAVPDLRGRLNEHSSNLAPWTLRGSPTVAIFTLLFIGLGEELGWRGFALPVLRADPASERTGAVRAKP